MQSVVHDAAGHHRSPVTMPGFHEGRAPRNKGRRYPADPPTVEEIIAVMRQVGSGRDGARLHALIVILWRAGLRIGEALDLAETDLDASRGAVLVRRGKGGRRREVGMDRWAWSQLDPWLALRRELPVGFAVVRGPRRDRWAALGRVLGPQAAGAYRGPGRRAAAVRAPSAASRPRCRDGARGCAAGGDPASARACEPRGHLDLSAGDRQLGDHRHGPLPACSGHLGHRRAHSERLSPMQAGR